MALGGAWVTANLGRGAVRLTGRTFGADADAAVIGLDGAAGTDVNLPAGFGVDGQGTPTGAQYADRVKVTYHAVTNPAGGAGAATWLQIVKGTAPFQITLTQRTAPAVAVQYEINVEYIHSLIRG